MCEHIKEMTCHNVCNVAMTVKYDLMFESFLISYCSTGMPSAVFSYFGLISAQGMQAKHETSRARHTVNITRLESPGC
jgi:hypothetical protein